MAFDLGDYKDVPARIADFKTKHPNGSLRAADLANPYRIETIGNQTFIVYFAAAFRDPDDPAPGIGSAWEPVPGQSPYTKNSELQNAETSAWGRAIVAVLASESKSVASQEDVRNRQADEPPLPPPLGDGWPGYKERDDAWAALLAATAELDEDVAAEVKAWVKSQGIVYSSFSVENATDWQAAIDRLTPAGDLPSGTDGHVPESVAASAGVKS